MFLKKYRKNLITIISIFFLALVSSLFIKGEFFSKKSFKVEYKIENYYLSSPKFIYKYIDIVLPLIKSNQYVVRNKVLSSKECDFLDKKINSFTISNKGYTKTIIAELFSNQNISDMELRSCFDIFQKIMNEQKNNLFQNVLTSDIQLYEDSLKYYEAMLDDKDFYESKRDYLPILFKVKTAKENIFYIKRFLNYVNTSNIIYIININYSSFSLNKMVIFLAIFFSYIIVYLIYLNLYRNKKLISKIFS